MLKIKNVTAKNFMSIGNITQAVNFETPSLTLVLGHNLDMGGEGSRNGTGKTTILNALSYAFYGEALTNIKKDNLINKTNTKQMLVTTEFSIGNTDYKIERGRRPNMLKLYVDGQESSNEEQQGDSRETQKDIERIVGLPHNMFKHLIALNTYTEPFLSMRTNEQRAMIEQLLGVTELSQKAEVLKEKIRVTKETIKEEEIKIATIRASNERIEKNIKDIELRSKAWDRTQAEKLAGMQAAIKTLSELDVDAEIAGHKQNSEAKELSDDVNVLRKELASTSTSFKRSEERLTSLQFDLKSAQEGTCPACGQGTAHLDTHAEYTKELEVKLREEQEYCDERRHKVAELTDAIGQIDVPERVNTFYKTIEEAYEHKHNLDTLVSQFQERELEVNPYVEQIEGLKSTGLQEIDFSIINDLTSLKDHQDMLLQLLTSKDSFIRKRIIEQNLAYLNHRLAFYLDRIGLPHDVKFNSDLSVDITEYGRDLDFDNLSRGERNRLILSMSWAFRDIYESLNRPMNLLFIDELVDSGMDSMGVENSLAILKKMNRDHGKNIFLISHKDELVGRVHNVLYVVKSGGFTEYNNDTDFVPPEN